jgi:hypothetical protein
MKYPTYAASVLAANQFVRCCFAAGFPLFGDQSKLRSLQRIFTLTLSSVRESGNSLGNLATRLPHLGHAAVSVRPDAVVDKLYY